MRTKFITFVQMSKLQTAFTNTS